MLEEITSYLDYMKAVSSLMRVTGEREAVDLSPLYIHYF